MVVDAAKVRRLTAGRDSQSETARDETSNGAPSTARRDNQSTRRRNELALPAGHGHVTRWAGLGAPHDGA